MEALKSESMRVVAQKNVILTKGVAAGRTSTPAEALAPGGGRGLTTISLASFSAVSFESFRTVSSACFLTGSCFSVAFSCVSPVGRPA